MTGPAVPSAATGVGRANTDRILRMFARFTSVGYLAYLALLYPSITTTTPHMHRWWTPLAVVVVFGSGMLPGLLSFHRSTAAMRSAAAAAALAFLAAAFTWPLAWTGIQLPAMTACGWRRSPAWPASPPSSLGPPPWRSHIS